MGSRSVRLLSKPDDLILIDSSLADKSKARRVKVEPATATRKVNSTRRRSL
jgi:hypothetical protein